MLYIGLEATASEHTAAAVEYYTEIFEDRQAGFAFPDPSIEVLADAVNMVYDSGRKVYLIFAYPECQWERIHIEALTGRPMYKPLGACHLTGFSGLSAYAHFSVHPDFVPFKTEVVKAGQKFLHWLFSLKRLHEPGVPLVETLIGTTPSYNIGALKFAWAVGFEKQFTIKKGMYSKQKGRYCGLVVSILTRDRRHER